MTPACPCCSGESYARCCEPFHKAAALPPTPVALMRSRYSAFARKQVDHLVRTLHPTHPDHHGGADVVRSLKKMCNRCTFPRLIILKEEPPDAAGRAYVTFDAHIQEDGKPVGFVERSLFLRHEGAWTYVSGEPPPR